LDLPVDAGTIALSFYLPGVGVCELVMATSISTRRVYLLLVYAACLLPAIVYGAQRILHTNQNTAPARCWW